MHWSMVLVDKTGGMIKDGYTVPCVDNYVDASQK
jgi:hypothetical protein